MNSREKSKRNHNSKQILSITMLSCLNIYLNWISAKERLHKLPHNIVTSITIFSLLLNLQASLCSILPDCWRHRCIFMMGKHLPDLDFYPSSYTTNSEFLLSFLGTFITTIFNGPITSGHVPPALNKTKAIPILRIPTVDPSVISNYQPLMTIWLQSGTIYRACHLELHASRSSNLQLS